jgi:cell fate (sporulation/competence/biofilm development) regulator YmcA (YheA/YmcA/DUF963 family)
MGKTICSSIFMCIGLGGTIAVGQSLLDGENLLVSPPKNFEVAHDSRSGNNSITEFVPAGETVEKWTQMLTVQVFRQSQSDATAFLQFVGKKFSDACPGTTLVGRGIETGRVNGYVVSMLFLKCPKNPETGKPESTVFRAIRGRDALYSFQQAWRAVPADQEVKDAIQTMERAVVCDTRSTEHPCPAYDPNEGWHKLN